jgi:hypothetical protein
MENDMITRLLVATVVGSIFMLLVGFLIFGVALNSYMLANTTQYPGLLKNPPNFILLTVAHLAFVGLLALVAEYWARVRTFSGGAKVGVLVTFPVAVWTDLMTESFMEIYIGIVPIIVDIIIATALGAITGGIIGVVLGKMDKPTETA